LKKKEHHKILKSIKDKYKSYYNHEVISDVFLHHDLPECLTNCSLIFEVNEQTEIIVIAIDPHIYYTGVVSRKINNNKTETFHLIQNKPPSHVKRIQIIEKLFCDVETGCAPKKECIVPMMIFTK